LLHHQRPCTVTARGPLPGRPTGSVTGSGVGPNGFNRQAFRTLAVPVQRYVFATRGTFEVAPSINVIAEGHLREDQLAA
jgi:iron complex outermembrane receptor protein